MGIKIHAAHKTAHGILAAGRAYIAGCKAVCELGAMTAADQTACAPALSAIIL